MASFHKRRADAPPGFFEVEAAGLRWLAVPGGVPVVGVQAVGNDELVIDRVDPAPPTRERAVRFGQQLVVTHDAGAVAFGCPPTGWSPTTNPGPDPAPNPDTHPGPRTDTRPGTNPDTDPGPGPDTGTRPDTDLKPDTSPSVSGFIGDAPLSLRPQETWGAFYAEQRVLPYARSAHRSGALSGAGLRIIERLADRVGAGEFDDPAPPARIHGDLWSGNVIFHGNSVMLIDPAAHGGHRITDLAMLALFGFPHLDTMFAAYETTSTWLPARWRSLMELHQLHPLLVHAVLFGGGYGDQAVTAASRY